jgi:parallel beta-helix repeat protein
MLTNIMLGTSPLRGLGPSLVRVFLAIVMFIGFFSVSTGYGEENVEIGMETIEEDTTWSGEITVTGDVYVPPGVTLTILPGTTVKFQRIDEQSGRNLFGNDTPYYPQAELIIRGRLIAQGTRDNIILFTSAERNASIADWGAINLLGSDDSIIEYCKIIFAYNGFHAHSSTALISHNEFIKNGVAITFKREISPNEAWYGKDTDITVIHNDIHNNKGGINVRNAKTLISYNRIKDNKFFGIWVKEKCNAYISYNDIRGNYKGIYLYQASGLTLHFNNIYNSKEYNLAIADEQEFEVDARYNWFGTVNKEKIDGLIFDKQDDPAVACIVYEPISRKKITGAGSDLK